MFEVRLHGRGGQGVVTAAELLSTAAFLDGKESQAIPSFGSERMGAPVVAFCRIDDKQIRMREPIAEPDVVTVADPTLLHHVDVFGGLMSCGFVLINSTRTPHELGLDDLCDRLPDGHVRCIPATESALRHIGRPMPNVCLLGALAAMTGVVSVDSLATAVRERFNASIADANVAAARECFTMMAAMSDA